MAMKPNGKSIASSDYDEKVMFFKDVSLGHHEAQLRFRLIHFWEAWNRVKKMLIGLEMLLIDEQVRYLGTDKCRFDYGFVLQSSSVFFFLNYFIDEYVFFRLDIISTKLYEISLSHCFFRSSQRRLFFHGYFFP